MWKLTDRVNISDIIVNVYLKNPNVGFIIISNGYICIIGIITQCKVSIKYYNDWHIKNIKLYATALLRTKQYLDIIT